MKEKDLAAQVEDLLELYKWHWVHFKTVKVQGKKGWYHETPFEGKPGFPDYVAVKGETILFIELKSDKGRHPPEQRDWGMKLIEAGQSYVVWRPRDWDTIFATLSSK